MTHPRACRPSFPPTSCFAPRVGSIRTFSREPAAERKVVGLDATLRPTPSDRDPFEGPIPRSSDSAPAYTMAVNRLLRSDIGIETDREYAVLSQEVTA
jgi:hypothetical protein